MKRHWPYLAVSAAVVSLVAVAALGLAANADAHAGRSLVGAWYFQAPAPFAPHLATFHEDGNMVVMFPDAAEAVRSASTGAGAWKRISGNRFKGTFYEINATRATNKFESNLIVTFTVTVNGDAFTGVAVARYVDAEGNLLDGPFEGPLTGFRIEA